VVTTTGRLHRPDQRLERAAHGRHHGTAPAPVWLGNTSTISRQPQSATGIYIDGDGSYRSPTTHREHQKRNGFQIYVNGGNGSSVATTSTSTHLIHDVSKHGITGGQRPEGHRGFDNVVYNVQYAGIRFNTRC